jgi:hypothetical protein
MNCFQVCYLLLLPILIVLIIVTAHLLRPENEYNRHKYQEVCRLLRTWLIFLIILSSVLIPPALDAHPTHLHTECLKAARILITPKVSHMIFVSTNPTPGLMLLTIGNVQRLRSIHSMSSDLIP